MTLSGTYSTADQSCPCSAQLFVGLTLSSRQCSPCSQITTQVTVTHSVAKRGEFSCFVGFLAQKGGQIFEDGDLWD